MPKYVMTKQQRRDAIVALEAAKTKLWNGIGCEYDEGRTEFICIAISKTCENPTVTWDTRDLIERSIAPFSTYTEWLNANVSSKARDWPDTKIQALRLRFVNATIRALRASLK